MPPQISVVIPTLGNYSTLARVLDGYTEQDVPDGTFEVVLVTDVADPDPDAVERAMGRRAFRLRRITGPMPGASANRNAGWRTAEAPLVLYTDNDTIPVPRLVAEHLEWHRRHPEEETGVLGHVRWARELEVTTFMRWLDTGIQFDFAAIEGIDAGWGRFFTANASLKRSFIERVGDFDQENLPYPYEDTDWAYRAGKLGFRLLYNRRAVVDHLRPMTLEFWQQRARRVAFAEHVFSRLHPEMPPWFHRVFTEAVGMPLARGRGIRLAPYVSRGVPWLGPKVWQSVDIAYKQALAPHFLEAWVEAEAATAAAVQSGPAELDSRSSGGSSPGGPK